jgi:DNA-binding winged helix-turn-helix (wHTH) protein
MLVITTNNGFLLHFNDTPNEPKSTAAQKLLIKLSQSAGTVHSRQTLATEFWPDKNRKTRTLFRHTIWHIRKELESTGAASEEYLQSDVTGV